MAKRRKAFYGKTPQKVILYLQGRRGFPRRHDVVAPRRFGVSKDIEPPNVSRVTTGRQRAAKSGKGRQRGGVSQPCGGKELPVLRLHATAGVVAPLKGVRTINLGRFRAAKVRLCRTFHVCRKSALSRGRSCAEPCGSKGRFRVERRKHSSRF